MTMLSENTELAPIFEKFLYIKSKIKDKKSKNYLLDLGLDGVSLETGRLPFGLPAWFDRALFKRGVGEAGVEGRRSLASVLFRSSFAFDFLISLRSSFTMFLLPITSSLKNKKWKYNFFLFLSSRSKFRRFMIFRS